MMGRSKSNKILQWRKRWCQSGIEGWWQTSFRPSPPRPLSLVTMSVTFMAASCDSIGTCSLDVDAESLADSLVDSAQVDSPHNRHKAGEPKKNASSLSQQTLHSLLLSASTNSGGQSLDNLNKSQTNLSTPSPSTAKKPSYLNLACSISGYGGITTYDSKLREGFRSRDHSPGKFVGLQNGSREASPARGLGACSVSSGNFLTAPNSGRLDWTTSPVTGLSEKANMKHMSPTIGGGQRINSTNGTNGTDQTDGTANFNVKRISDQRNRWLESTLSPLEKNKGYQKVISVIESRSGQHGLQTETSVETRYEEGSRSQSTVVSSTTVISSSSLPQQYSSTLRSERVIPISIERDSLADQYGHQTDKRQTYTNGATSHQTPVSTKSFIQQRVERLYGPCALAQGFFHRSSKGSFSTSHSSHVTNGVNFQVKPEAKTSPDKSGSSPELPVLRHLRPEFRDQLTVAPRRSLGQRFSNGSSPTNTSAPTSTSSSAKVQSVYSVQQHQMQTSTESLADLQPAAPEVVLPQQSHSVSPMTKDDNMSVGKLKTEAHDTSNVASVQESKLTAKTVDDGSALLPVISPVVVEENDEEAAGHKFLKIQRQTIVKLLELAAKAEKEIEESGAGLSEEALGHLRSAAGQARLLVTQKMVQFEGLCHKCLNQRPDEPFPTTAEDLQGFWDMLLLQVDQVHNTFQRLDKLKEVGWCEDKLAVEDKPKPADSLGTRTPSSSSKRTPRTPKSATSNTAKAAEAAALRKQREEDRRKLMEQRRRELKQKQQSELKSSDSKETVEIFGAQPS